MDKTIDARTYVYNLAGENRDKEPVEDEEVLIESVGSAKKKGVEINFLEVDVNLGFM